MTVYDWSKASRETAERLMSATNAWYGVDNEEQGGWCDESKEMFRAVKAARAEALVLRPRTRAEVDAEIGTVLRRYMLGENEEDQDDALWHRIEDLVTEPIAPEPGNPVTLAEARANALASVPDPDPPEACSCEESERLKTRIAELEDKGYRATALLIDAQQAASKAEADRDHYKGIWQVECDRTVRALKHQETAESEARALRAKIGRVILILDSEQKCSYMHEALEALRA